MDDIMNQRARQKGIIFYFKRCQFKDPGQEGFLPLEVVGDE